MITFLQIPLNPILVSDGAHDAGDVIRHGEHNQCYEKPITASQEIAEPAAHRCKNDLYHVPELLHILSSSSIVVPGRRT